MSHEEIEETRSTEVQIRAVQGWMALDLHMALGYEVDHYLEHQGYPSWADWWSNLVWETRRRTADEKYRLDI